MRHLFGKILIVVVYDSRGKIAVVGMRLTNNKNLNYARNNQCMTFCLLLVLQYRR